MTDDRLTPVPSAFRPRVLVVDDDVAYVDFWTKKIPTQHKERVEFKLVLDLEAAFRELYRNDDHYHVVLLDLGLPPYMGIDTFRAFRKRIHNVPVVVLTATQDMELSAKLYNEGAAAVLWKDASTPTGIVKTIFDVRLAEQHRSSVEGAIRQAARDAEEASESYRTAVHNSEPPLERERRGADLHVENTRALSLLAQVSADYFKEFQAMRTDVQLLRMQAAEHEDHPQRIAVLEERSRHQHDSFVDLREEARENKREQDREVKQSWASRHKSELIVGLATAVVAVVYAIIAALTGRPLPPPPQLHVPQPPPAQEVAPPERIP